LDIDYNRGLFR